MKPSKLLTIAGIIGASLLPFTGAKAQDNNLNVNLNGNYASEMRFWGMPFIDSPMYTQSLNFNHGKFMVSLSGTRNMDTEKLYSGNVLLNYTQPISSKLTASVGKIYFKFNLGGYWDDASVSYAGLNADMPFNPAISYNKLTGFGGGEYIEGSLSKTFPVNNKVAVSTSAKIGYNAKALRDKTSFSHLEEEVSIPIQVTDRLNITPKLKIIFPLAEDVSGGDYWEVNASYDLK